MRKVQRLELLSSYTQVSGNERHLIYTDEGEEIVCSVWRHAGKHW